MLIVSSAEAIALVAGCSLVAAMAAVAHRSVFAATAVGSRGRCLLADFWRSRTLKGSSTVAIVPLCSVATPSCTDQH